MTIRHNCSDCVHRKDFLVPCDWLKEQTEIVLDCLRYEQERTHTIQMPARSGKTLAAVRSIVKWSSGTGQAVAVFSEDTKALALEEAARQGVTIPEPVVVNLKREKPAPGITFAGIIVDNKF